MQTVFIFKELNSDTEISKKRMRDEYQCPHASLIITVAFLFLVSYSKSY